MNVLVTGVGGQLGHDVMNELYKRGYQGTGSDIQPEYAGAQDGSPVTTMPYISLDITDRDAVMKAVRRFALTSSSTAPHGQLSILQRMMTK